MAISFLSFVMFSRQIGCIFYDCRITITDTSKKNRYQCILGVRHLYRLLMREFSPHVDVQSNRPAKPHRFTVRLAIYISSHGGMGSPSITDEKGRHCTQGRHCWT